LEHDLAKLRIKRAGQKLLLYAALACILLAVFSLYSHPDFLVTLANQLWSCF
jgi:hypothetical protein